jgi:hypothetical protein
MMTTYTAFQVATVLYVKSAHVSSKYTSWVLVLFAVSIPATFAFGRIHRFDDTDESLLGFFVYISAMTLAFVPSLSALTILIGEVSRTASLVFLVSVLVWSVVLFVIQPFIRRRKKMTNSLTLARGGDSESPKEKSDVDTH